MSTEEAPSVELDLREHMKRTIQTAVYPFAGLGDPQALMYVGLGLAGESGEVANQIKKVARDNGGLVTPDRRDKITDELGDVAWYWLRMCYELGLDPYDVLERNRAKLAQRAVSGTLQGDGVHRGARERRVALEWEADLTEAAGKEDVFGVPLEGYEKLIQVLSRYDKPGGLKLIGFTMTCSSLRCQSWALDYVPGQSVLVMQQDGMAHIMAEHTPWGRAGRE
jgi:NTP pyrophosphatase (non-canonical NTP hydrolase)